MKEILFLEYPEVVELHLSQVERYGGAAGIRDQGMLRSALEMPRSGFGDEYFHRTLFEMASAYLFHIAMNHPFVDGNKRTAAMTAVVFLKMNGVEFEPPEGTLADITLGVAEGRLEKPAVAALMERHSRTGLR